MYTLSDIGEVLGRHPVQLGLLLKRFELPRTTGIGYPECYAGFLRLIVFLRLAQVPEDRILMLWSAERKLMTLLHADTLGSPTWMIDGHGQSGADERRLFLSRYDVGADLSCVAVQPGLDFSDQDVELFSSGEMGEDTLRQLRGYIELRDDILESVEQQEGVLRAAGEWARKLRRSS